MKRRLSSVPNTEETFIHDSEAYASESQANREEMFFYPIYNLDSEKTPQYINNVCITTCSKMYAVHLAAANWT